MNIKLTFSFILIFFNAAISFASHSSSHCSDASSMEEHEEVHSFETWLKIQDLDNFPDPGSLPLVTMDIDTPEKYIAWFKKKTGIRKFRSFPVRGKTVNVKQHSNSTDTYCCFNGCDCVIF